MESLTQHSVISSSNLFRVGILVLKICRSWDYFSLNVCVFFFPLTKRKLMEDPKDCDFVCVSVETKS